MSESTEFSRGWPGRVAVAIRHGDPPEVVLAESDAVLSRVLALHYAAQLDASRLDARTCAEIREALLEERWADAVLAWMSVEGEVIDAYPDEVVWTDQDLDLDRAAMEIRVAPIFRTDPGRQRDE